MNQKEKKDKYYVFGFLGNAVDLSLFTLLKPYFFQLFLGFLVLFVTNMISISLPRLVNKGVSFVEGQKNVELDLLFFSWSIKNIISIVAFIIFLSVLGIFIRTLSRILIFDIGRNVEKDVRTKLYKHLSLQDDTFYLNYSVGDLINHLTNDIANIRFITGFSILNIINIAFSVVLTIPLLVAINLKLAIICLLPFPLMILATKVLSTKIFFATKEYQEKMSDLVSHVQENLLLSQLVRLFHRQDYETNRFTSTNDQAYLAALKFSRLRIMMYPLTRLVLGLSVGLILLFGLNEVLQKNMTLGDFVEFNARIFQLSWPFMSIGFVISSYSRGMASLSRINMLLGVVPSIIDGNKKLSNIRKIDIVDLDFSNEKLVRKKINISIHEGETIGIVGPTGSFKSTLLKIISRRKVVSYGNIFFNENDINNLTLDSINDYISVVTQEPFLFHTSIKENICFAKDNISQEEIKHVLEITGLDKDIATFENGLETVIGERGITLSGGQKQRVAIARAILASKPILILDDALSSVDVTTEKQIIKGIYGLSNISIKIIASNRLSVVKNANQILVMNDGEIVAQGTHEQLLHESKLYGELLGLKGKINEAL